MTDIPNVAQQDGWRQFWVAVDAIAGDVTVDLVIGREEASLFVAGLGVVARGRSHGELLERLMAHIEESIDQSSDQLMRVTLYRCGECEGVASAEAWNAAWWKERSRRMGDPAWNDDDYGKDYGLDEKMVCPRCRRVHADDDSSYVEDVAGIAEVAP